MQFLLAILLISGLSAEVSINAAKEATKKLNEADYTKGSFQAENRAEEDFTKADGKDEKQGLPEVTVPVSTVFPQIIDRLIRLHHILSAKKDIDLPEIETDRALHPNDKNDAIIILRKILHTLDYSDELKESPFYDLELEHAVKNFQAGHCIEPDGILGEKTVARLNWSVAKRLKLLQETIDSLKKISFKDKTIIVNIPTYNLHCFEDVSEVGGMKVIVGQPNRETPLMTSYINALTYYPEWTIPTKMFFKDKLPLIQNDSEYFEKNNLELVQIDGDHEEVDASEIDWAEVEQYDFPYLVKQKSGDKNALGRVKFNLVNDDLIYLHDTPQKKLFKKFSRAFSSGCIRVAKPIELAGWLLDKEKGTVKNELKDKETKTIKLENNVVVQIMYLPVWAEKDGRLLWGDDPYNFKKNPYT